MLLCRFGCSRQFQTKAAMEDHRRKNHPSAAPMPVPPRRTLTVACNDCHKMFSSTEALRQHQLTVPDHIRPSNGLGSLGCEKCNRTLRSQDALEQHFAEDHSLIMLAADESKRIELEARFIESWRKQDTRPGRVLAIYRIYNPAWRSDKFQKYRQTLPNGGNQVQRYHGTTLLCDLGSGAENSKLCQNDGCNLCCILRTGFKTAKVKDTWQRFGKGIYTTATSGKSNDYIRSSSKRRAVLVCRVLAGNVFRTQVNNPTLQAPPPGYDSVSGEVGKVLNYDETVVYTSKAILPDYMIVYDM